MNAKKVLNKINRIFEDENRDFDDRASNKKVYFDDFADRHVYYCSTQEVYNKLINNLKNFYSEKFENIQIKPEHQYLKSFSHSQDGGTKDRDVLDYKVTVDAVRKPTWTRYDAFEFPSKRKEFFKKLGLSLSKAFG